MTTSLISTISAKGQTTIPIAVRKNLHANIGDKVEYILLEPGKVLMVHKDVSFEALKKILPRPKKTATLKEIEKAIGSAWAGEH